MKADVISPEIPMVEPVQRPVAAASPSKDEPIKLTEVPIIDFELFLNGSDKGAADLECKKVIQSFHQYGIAIVRDPRVGFEKNDEYIDMIENYFETISEGYYKGEPLEDCRPELSYQTGVTPEHIEMARNHESIVESLTGEDKPLTKYPMGKDCKWRFFWPIGERPESIRNEIPKVYPRQFPQWEEKMDSWGNHMIDAVYTASEMCAIGLGIARDSFTEKMNLGQHLLAPTASDLCKYEVGAPFASFHYDLNFITIHGKSRFPGLFLWTRDFKKQAVKVPQGCLLLQAGIMLEWMTGGYVKAGFHEVIYTEATKKVRDEKIKRREETGVHESHWRISSTLFSHIRHDVDISPMSELAHVHIPEAAQKYTKMTSFEKLMEELRAINLAPKQSFSDN